MKFQIILIQILIGAAFATPMATDGGFAPMPVGVNAPAQSEKPDYKKMSDLSNEELTKCIESSSLFLAEPFSTGLRPSKSEAGKFQDKLNRILKLNPDLPVFCRSFGTGSIMISMDPKTMKALRKKDYEIFESVHTNLKVKEISAFTAIDTVVIRYKEPYSFQGLKDLYQKVPGVKYIENDRIIGGGSSGVEFHEKSDEFYFKVGWGDCFAGCIHGHSFLYGFKENKPYLVEEKSW